MAERQVQRGSQGAQLQAGRDIIQVQGVDLDTAKEVIEAKAIILRGELTDLAAAAVDERMRGLEDRLLHRMQDTPMLAAFASPDFQFNILEAQRSAARSSSGDDLDLLVDILAQRAEFTETPRLKMATRKALDVVGQVSTQTLMGLTALWYGIRLTTDLADLGQYLDDMETRLAPLVEFGLPAPEGGQAWLSDLAELGCVRLGFSGIGGLKTFTQIIATSKFPALTATGLDETQASALKQRLEAYGLDAGGLVVPHPIVPGMFSLVGQSETAFREIADRVPRSESVNADYDSVIVDAVVQNHCEQTVGNWEGLLRDLLATRPGLMAIDKWWHDFPAVELTSVGVALAYANFRRAVPNITFSSLDGLFG